MGIKLGLVGLGSFGGCFAPLFASHPSVDSIALCDAEESKLKNWAENAVIAKKLDRNCVFTSFDDICASDCDALAIITQPWLHAPQCIQALNSGKDVYSAVPVICLPDDDEMLEWCHKIQETVKKTGKHYMLGETTIYRPQTMFCKRMAKQKLFGDFVFAEAEYAHDVDCYTCSLRQVKISRTTGKIGEQSAAFFKPYRERGLKSSPMNYPTHSVSGVVEVMESKPVKVSAYGYRNANRDPHFTDSDFSNVVALFQMDNGSAFRVAECREISPNTGLMDEDFRIFGTRGSYSYSEWRNNGRTAPTPEPKENKSQKLSTSEMQDRLPAEVAACFNEALNRKTEPGDDFVPSGHGGSHPYLVNEFVSSVLEQRESAIPIEKAATYMAMGVAAHKSAQRDGELVKVEDFGIRW